MEKKEVGKVIHFFGKIMVAAIKLSDTVKIGDKLSIEGATTGFEQVIESMQIDKKDVPEAGVGDDIGIKVTEKVREGDTVYKVIE
jgi:putative protease